MKETITSRIVINGVASLLTVGAAVALSVFSAFVLGIIFAAIAYITGSKAIALVATVITAFFVMNHFKAKSQRTAMRNNNQCPQGEIS